jgi:hypothetical protein
MINKIKFEFFILDVKIFSNNNNNEEDEDEDDEEMDDEDMSDNSEQNIDLLEN